MPYGGEYVFRDPMLPTLMIAGPTWEILVSKAYAARRANAIPTGLEFEQEIERSICRDYPAECSGWDPNMPRPRGLTFHDVISGTKVLVAFKLAGSPLVERSEAERRAEICRNCPMNVSFTAGCNKCRDLSDMVQKVIQNQSTRFDDQLKSCSICGCYTRLAVWLPLSIQCRGVTEAQRQEFSKVENCWKSCAVVGSS